MEGNGWDDGDRGRGARWGGERQGSIKTMPSERGLTDSRPSIPTYLFPPIYSHLSIPTYLFPPIYSHLSIPTYLFPPETIPISLQRPFHCTHTPSNTHNAHTHTDTQDE